MGEYAGIVISLVMAGTVAGALLVLASKLGPKRPSAVKSEPFECGQVPFSVPVGRLSIKFYLTAILFIVFDVELVFLYPWAVVYRRLGASGLAEIVIFLGVLMAGFFYAWDNGPWIGSEMLVEEDLFTTRLEEAIWLGPQVLHLPVPLRDGLLRDGVYGHRLLPLRYRPLRRRAGQVLSAPIRCALRGGHDQPQDGAGAEEIQAG